MDVRLRLLGPPLVYGDDGREVLVPRGKPTTLLTLLATRHGQAVGSDVLISALWGDKPPRSVAANLQNYVSALRSVLDTASEAGSQRLRLSSGGYQLRLSRDECDLFEFEQLLIAGRSAAKEGNHRKAAMTLRRAIRLWQANPFAVPLASGVPDESLLLAEAQVWDEVRLTAYEDCIEAELAVEPRAGLVPELRRLIVENPVRERIHLLLMHAFYAIGDSAAALSAYADARAALVAELGVEPGKPLRELHAKILRGELPAAPEPGSSGTEPATVHSTVSWQFCQQLPRDVPDFVGRVDVVSAASAHLTSTESVAVVALTGPAGTGKTTAAVHIGHLLADRFPDGQLFVSLGGGNGPAREPDQVLAGVLRSLGLPDSAVPATGEDRAAMLRSLLAGRRVLIVLDDAVDSAQVSPLLPGTPGSAVLITSRNRLVDLTTSIRRELDGFSRADARALLAAVIGAERVDAESAVVDELLDHTALLPLAVRVVAGRLATRPHWSLGSLLSRLRDEGQRDRRAVLDELTVGNLDVRAGFATSYAALGDRSEQAAFRRFALAGVADLPPWAMSALAGVPNFDRVVARLLDSHLLEPAHAEDERYRMHDLLRRYAEEECAAVDGDVHLDTPAGAALRRLFDAARALVGVAYEALPTPADWLPPIGPEPTPSPDSAPVTDDPMAWCDQEMDLLVAVVTAAATAGWSREALDLVERLGGFLAMGSRREETERLFAALNRAPGLDDEVRAHTTYGLAEARMMGGELAEAAVLFEECTNSFDRLGEHVGLAHSLTFLSFCRMHEGRLDEAGAQARRAVAVATRFGDPRCRVRSLRQLGTVLLAAGHATHSVRLLERALDLADDLDVPDLDAVVLSSLAKALLRTRDLARADAAAQRAAEVLDHIGQPVARSHVRLTQAEIAELRGQHGRAIDEAQRSLRVFRELGDRRGEADANYRLGINELRLGHAWRAVPLLRAAVSIFHELGLREPVLLAEGALHDAAGQLGA